MIRKHSRSCSRRAQATNVALLLRLQTLLAACATFQSQSLSHRCPGTSSPSIRVSQGIQDIRIEGMLIIIFAANFIIIIIAIIISAGICRRSIAFPHDIAYSPRSFHSSPVKQLHNLCGDEMRISSGNNQLVYSFDWESEE
ncbi:uncharacterized protein BDV17DRAFT_224597 [Aspergillus undulatus]|uniref:uncharacterized protein n=1 Tax=Aspergillus undulatus TaxID=1810928 RepID=UPI003CCD36B5